MPGTTMTALVTHCDPSPQVIEYTGQNQQYILMDDHGSQLLICGEKTQQENIALNYKHAFSRGSAFSPGSEKKQGVSSASV